MKDSAECRVKGLCLLLVTHHSSLVTAFFVRLRRARLLQSRAMAWTRREFMRGLATAGLVGVSVTSTYAALVEPRAYELTETDIHIPDLPPAFDGVHIAQVSDLHHSPIVPHA